jgi:hypothetical protein
MRILSHLSQGPSVLCAALIAVMPLSAVPTTAVAAEVTSDVTFIASADEVWDAIGPFCSISDWYPGLDSCTEEQIDGATHRRLVTADGGQFLEKLLAHDDEAMNYRYAIVEGPLPVANYSATISVTQLGDQTRVVWSGTFEPKGASEAEAVDVVTGVYDAGLEAIRQSFKK